MAAAHRVSAGRLGQDRDHVRSRNRSLVRHRTRCGWGTRHRRLVDPRLGASVPRPPGRAADLGARRPRPVRGRRHRRRRHRGALLGPLDRCPDPAHEPQGGHVATRGSTPDGGAIWWFDDGDGDEYGVWRRQPFGAGPGEGVGDPTGLTPAYPAGLALGRDGLAVVGTRGRQVRHPDPRRPARPPRTARSTSTPRTPGSAALSEDDALLAIVHSEHEDSRHPAVRVVRLTDDRFGETVADLWDGAGKGRRRRGLRPGRRRHPAAGQPRAPRRRGSCSSGTSRRVCSTSSTSACRARSPTADWFRDGSALLVSVDHEARTRLYRVELPARGSAQDGTNSAAGAGTPAGRQVMPVPLGRPDGTAAAATARPDEDVWVSWSSAAEPPASEASRASACSRHPATRPRRPCPSRTSGSAARRGPVHALLRRPVDADGHPLPGPAAPARRRARRPDRPRHRRLPGLPERLGRPRLRRRPGELPGLDRLRLRLAGRPRGARSGTSSCEDVVAVRDHLVATGVADADRVVLGGASWGGYLTLLGLGLYPDRWALGLAGVPVADYVAAYEDEMEALKAFDRSLFGGSPDDVPEKYRRLQPDDVRGRGRRAGARSSRARTTRAARSGRSRTTSPPSPRAASSHEVYRYEAGHGSLVDDERVRQTRVELDFAARHLPAPGA